MGNMLKVVQDSGWTMTRPASVQIRNVAQEDFVLLKLLDLQEVELLRVHWCLSQKLLQDVPPVPPHWLWSADAHTTAKIMLKCYHEDGALTMLDVVLTTISQDSWVCPLLRTVQPTEPGLGPNSGADFMKTQRRKLISWMQWPGAVLDSLQVCGILNSANREAFDVYAVHRDKNRALVDLVLRKGEKAQEMFCQALSHSELFLLQELEDEQITYRSVLTEMLEFLVSDELRFFQWLVSEHMTGESCPSIDGEQLQHADRLTTQRLLTKHFGPKQAEELATDILLKIVPTLSVCLQREAITSQKSSDISGNTMVDTAAEEFMPEVFEEENMFRLRCKQPGVFHCTLTGLVLEGFGDVVYHTVPWDVDFLSSRGLRPAGPLFKFTLLTGSFHRLHLPHCQLLSDQQLLSVAHVTADGMDLTPGQVTEGHVIINISSFSCFGLVTSVASDSAINSLVLLFSQLSNNMLFVLLLPRNICLFQVIKEWKRRITAEYVETIPDCELIPNQMYQLSGEPVNLIQPQSSKFVNFSDYHNFLPSFQVQLAADVRTLELQLRSHVTPPRLIGWLFGSKENLVWQQVVQLRAAPTVSTEGSVCVPESEDGTHLLLGVLDSLRSEDLKHFQRLLSLQSDPIPISRLEAADRSRTVDLMVQQYHPEGAKEVTVDILRRMNYNQLADHLWRS